MKRKGILVIVSGFSGAGKGTLMKRLMEMHGEQYALSVSMTTRQPRPGEQEGISYFFVDTETFEKTIGENGLIEYASYCDNYYPKPPAAESFHMQQPGSDQAAIAAVSPGLLRL